MLDPPEDCRHCKAEHQAWLWLGMARSITQWWLGVPVWVMVVVHMEARRVTGTNKICPKPKAEVAHLEWGVLRRIHGNCALLPDLLAKIC